MTQAEKSTIRHWDNCASVTSADVERNQDQHQLLEDSDSTIREVSRCIVALSSDYYWESDEEYRITRVSYPDRSQAQNASDLLVGKRTWETDVVPVNSTWEKHREKLEAREPFRDLLLKDPAPDGSMNYVSVSGMPRFKKDGVFAGYLGVTRNVTDDVCLKIISDLEVAVMERLAGTGFLRAISVTMRLICKKLGLSWGRYWQVTNNGRGKTLRLRASTRAQERASRRVIPIGPEVPRGTDAQLAVRACIIQKRMSIDLKPSSVSTGARSEARKGFAIPLQSHTGIFGVFEFRADRINVSISRLDKFLVHFAAQVAIAYERERATTQLRESEDRFASTFELAAVGLCHVGRGGRIVHVNQSLIDMLGYTREELLTMTVGEISHADDRNQTELLITKLENREIHSFDVEKRYVRKDGECIWVRIKTVMKRGDQEQPLYHVSVVEDISARKAAEEKIEHMATHDELTGLPNRALFNELTSQSIRSMRRSKDGNCAVLFLDLDRFKNINDSLGHHAGDALLKKVAERVKATIRSTDCVSRFGGDEFVVLLNEVRGPSQVEEVGKKILSTLAEPMQLENQRCRVTASIGVAMYPEDGTDARTLIRNADAAMYSAKQSGRNCIDRFSIDLTPTAINKLRLENQLQEALRQSEFRIVYQPRVDAATGRLVGAEALLRWWSAELGTIPPVQFIPVAEDTGLIIPIGRWLLQSVCGQHLIWRQRGLRPIVVSVNLSPKQFTDPELVDTVAKSLEAARMDPNHLELEITEGMLVSDLEAAMKTAAEIRALGVRLAIDDFGTGYSSLMQLKRFPLDTLKIDRSLVRDLLINREDRAITEAIVAMGRTLGASIVAEGVENDEQCALLRELRCDEFQGFRFGEPGHPDEISTRLRRDVN